ncbi:helix-turn-helix domain-containing protein [Peptoniphilus harei]|uniref:helix-turn-helix domain-containing protein n=1 Tax=Peptoniphilus harei TaxID=54005 RepID=UPI0025875F7F|nr:helix-turn-helix transcriptional regulator [Peptoniphilus harei]MDU6744163.1 helix-turn-helix transcriptional regulator [Peptoniphilus harei]
MIKEELGQEIRRLRTSQSYSQEDFAKLSGIDRTYISDVEQGKRNVSIDNIEKIAKALNVTLPELFSFNRPIQKTIILTVNGEEFILESNKELTRDIKDHIEAIADYFYDEDNEWFTEDMYEMSPYEIADLFEKAVKDEVGIGVAFKAIDLEIKIED